MITKQLLIITTLIISSVLLLLSFHGDYAYHFRSDTDGFYYPRAKYLLENGNFTNLGYNEYQPGALYFFVSLVPILLINNSVEVYRMGLYFLNIGLFSVLTYMIAKQHSKTNALIFQIIVLATGPILLSRFELYMFLLIYLSIQSFKTRLLFKSGFFLGLATATKIFPVLLIPYFILSSWKQSDINKAKNTGRIIVGILAGFMLINISYVLLFRVQPPQLLKDMSIHSKKPVHAESVWGSYFTIKSKISTGNYALGKGNMGIFGIDPTFVDIDLTIINYIWIIPWLLLLYLGALRRLDHSVIPLYIMIIISTFLVFSKILTPQYLFWFSALFVLLRVPKSEQTSKLNHYYLLLGCILFLAWFSQLIYPLKYNQLLGQFYTGTGAVEVFSILLFRNLLLISTSIYLAWVYHKKVFED